MGHPDATNMKYPVCAVLIDAGKDILCLLIGESDGNYIFFIFVDDIPLVDPTGFTYSLPLVTLRLDNKYEIRKTSFRAFVMVKKLSYFTGGKVLYEKVSFPQMYAIFDSEISLIPSEYTQVFVSYQFEWSLNVIRRTLDFHRGSWMIQMYLSKSKIIQLSRRTLVATASGNSFISFTAESVYEFVIDQIMEVFRPRKAQIPHNMEPDSSPQSSMPAILQ